MTGETSGSAYPEGRGPSLDPRDPRGEADHITELARKIQNAITEDGSVALSDDRAADLTRLIADALRRKTERDELGHIAKGHTSEGAADLVISDLEARRAALETMIDADGGTGTDAALAAPGAPGQLPPPGQQPLPGQTPPNPEEGMPPATPNPEGL